MPTYEFESDCGKLHEQHYPIGEAPKTIELDGVVYHRLIVGSNVSVPSTQWRTHASEAAAVPPHQVDQYRKYDKKHGCSVDYDSAGRPTFKSRKQRAKYLKKHGMFDRSGGYSDPAPDKAR